MLDRGYLTLFRLGGVPVRAHWSLPLGVLVFSGGRLAPGLWLGFVLLIALHELGHAFVVKRAGLTNLGIDLTGFGGQCRWAGAPTPIERALVAWGGVLAQAVVLMVTGTLVLALGSPTTPWLADLSYAFLWINLCLIAINLIPFPPLDGAEAWPLFGHLRRRRAARARHRREAPPAPPPPRRPEVARPVAARRADRSASAEPPKQTLAEALREADERRR